LSLHDAPVFGVTVQLAVPLQARVLHVSDVQVIGVPAHMPSASQLSPKVHASLSLHDVPDGSSASAGQ
jgi:hypothetical protein